MGASSSASKGESTDNHPTESESTSQEYSSGKKVKGKFTMTVSYLKKKTCSAMCLKILLVIFCILCVLLSIGTIAVTVASAASIKLYLGNHHRLVAMIVLTVTAAVSLAMAVYAMVAVFKKKHRPVHATAVTMVILVIIQAIILGVSMRVVPEDETIITKSLIQSFRLARELNPKSIKIWSASQNAFHCCGVYSPEDYRDSGLHNYFPPDIPVSCCPGYDKSRAEILQEAEKQVCKVRKQYYADGCKDQIANFFIDSARLVSVMIIILIILEVIIAVIGAILNKGGKKGTQSDEERAAK